MQPITPFALLALFITVTISAPDPPDDLFVQAGHHVIYSYPGPEPPTHLLDLTRAGKVGGIILFSENVSANLSAVVQSFQAAHSQSPAALSGPLLIMTDQEGGQIKRVPGGPELSAKAVGSSADPAGAAAEAGEQAATTLNEFSINVNLAPVLDVYRVDDDFEDHLERSYGNTSQIVATCSREFIKAQQGAGVLAAAKHFPGLGPAATDENTDERPVTISKTLAELRSADEEPYKAAIEEGTGMIMTSWALYPSLDADYPAGLSSKWIQGELRERLGYRGVTVSDAIEAGGLEAFGIDSDRAVLATRAGLDLVLAAARNVTQGELIVNKLAEAVTEGELDSEAFDGATKRIVAMRKSLKG